jgi:D-glycero-D-manno-heptose 1,7-bisphosphate phosphatase
MDAKKRYDRVVFLDRDGVINKPPPEGSWVFRWEEFEFAEGSLAALRRLHENGFTVVVMTNQSCVGRGVIALETVSEMNERMVEAVAAAGGDIARVCLCPHAPDNGCSCRKPKPGMIDQAARELGLRPERAFLVGDSPSDMLAGHVRGCTTILVGGPAGRDPDDAQADHTVKSLEEAVALIFRLMAIDPSGGR